MDPPNTSAGIEVEVLETQQVVRYGLCTHDGSYTLDYYDEEIDVSHLSGTAEKVEYFEAHIIKKASVSRAWAGGRGGIVGWPSACIITLLMRCSTNPNNDS